MHKSLSRLRRSCVLRPLLRPFAVSVVARSCSRLFMKTSAKRLRASLGRPVSVEETVEFAMKDSRLKPSDFAGSLSLTHEVLIYETFPVQFVAKIKVLDCRPLKGSSQNNFAHSGLVFWPLASLLAPYRPMGRVCSSLARGLPKPATSQFPHRRRTLRDPWCQRPKSLRHKRQLYFG